MAARDGIDAHRGRGEMQEKGTVMEDCRSGKETTPADGCRSLGKTNRRMGSAGHKGPYAPVTNKIFPPLLVLRW